MNAHVVFHEFGHIWFFNHRRGTYANCSLIEEAHELGACPASAFIEGFADFFSCHLYMDQRLPIEPDAHTGCYVYTRDLESIETLEDAERYDKTIAATLLNFTEGFAFDEELNSVCSYDFPRFAFQDILTVFLPDEEAGWPGHLSTSQETDGLWNFLLRARDILPQFTDEYHDKFVQLHDPGAYEVLNFLCPNYDFGSLFPVDPDDDRTIEIPGSSSSDDDADDDDTNETIDEDDEDEDEIESDDTETLPDSDDALEDLENDSDDIDDFDNPSGSLDDVDIDTFNPPAVDGSSGSSDAHDDGNTDASTSAFVGNSSGCSLTSHSLVPQKRGQFAFFGFVICMVFLLSYPLARFQQQKQ